MKTGRDIYPLYHHMRRVEEDRGRIGIILEIKFRSEDKVELSQINKLGKTTLTLLTGG